MQYITTIILKPYRKLFDYKKNTFLLNYQTENVKLLLWVKSSYKIKKISYFLLIKLFSLNKKLTLYIVISREVY